jgi:hypothetical protein
MMTERRNVLVPSEPTEAMLIAMARAAYDFTSKKGLYPRSKAVYAALLAAAQHHADADESTVEPSPANAGNIVYRGEEWVPLEAYREAMDGWKAANAADGINYRAWATNMIAFIRERDLEVQFKDWSGGWPCPVTGARPFCPTCGEDSPDGLDCLKCARWWAANGQQASACERCQGNGEIIGDWERYLNPEEGDVGDNVLAPCPDCDGTGDKPAPDLRAIERAEWFRLSKVECAARDARDAILAVVDNHKELNASTERVLEKVAEELRVAINGETECD